MCDSSLPNQQEDDTCQSQFLGPICNKSVSLTSQALDVFTVGIQNSVMRTKTQFQEESASICMQELGLGFWVYPCFGICKLRRCV